MKNKFSLFIVLIQFSNSVLARETIHMLPLPGVKVDIQNGEQYSCKIKLQGLSKLGESKSIPHKNEVINAVMCPVLDLDSQAGDDLVFAYSDIDKRPPCKAVVVLNFRSSKSEAYSFTISDPAQSCAFYPYLVGKNGDSCIKKFKKNGFYIPSEGGHANVIFFVDSTKKQISSDECGGSFD